MENNDEQKPKLVEELKCFPFNSFYELKKATTEGVANIGIDRSVALRWVRDGIYSSAQTRAHAIFLSFIPYIVAIGFIIYAIITKNWLLILALPALLIGFFIFHPSSAIMFGFARGGLIGLTFIGLVYGFINGIGWLTAFTLSLAFIWYAQQAIYQKSSNELICAVLEHEDLLCLLWNGQALNIKFRNGDSYWCDWKTENGQYINYNEIKTT